MNHTSDSLKTSSGKNSISQESRFRSSSGKNNSLKGKSVFLFFAFLLFSTNLFSQVQIVKGIITDQESKSPLPGVTVLLTSDTSSIKGTTTDMDGNFRLENIPVGRHSFKIRFVGYKEINLQNIIVNSAKEVVLKIEMEESVVQMQAVEITATKKGEAHNEMSSVSTRTFSIEETERYAGSRSDPARMASNFAGVQGADDSRNDIVIRGNSPMGLLWRVEDIDVPNPSHFAIPGTTGGGISLLNNKMFGNSEFYTSAFPAEYGNAISGVFDIHFRNGNNERHEFTGQFGFLGTELSGEGPISKKSGASYLFVYRYSTLRMFEELKIKIGTSAVPTYQDLNFKLNFPTKKAGNFSVFGFGGTSKIAIVISKFTSPQEEIYGEKDRDQYFGTSLGTIGVTHSYSINPTTYTKFTLANYASDAHAYHELVYRDSSYQLDSLVPKVNYKFINSKYTGNFSLNKKFNAKHSIKTGFKFDYLGFDMFDSNYVERAYYWEKRLDFEGNSWLMNTFLQWKYKITDDLVLNTGLHQMLFGLNNSFSLEPRAGMRWNFKSNQALSFGYGLHSQLQPSYIYFHQILSPLAPGPNTYVQHNRNIGPTRSHHFVTGYDISIGKSARIRIESYYQYLFEIPVEHKISSFSLLNQGSTFTRFFPDPLENKGKGWNKGLEFTLEKFFSKSYFYLLTLSYFDSKYKGSDGVLRNTDFNGRFASNFLLGKEFKLGSDKRILSTGTKITWAGGRRYTPADTLASRLRGELVEIDGLRNSKQFRDYFRLDLKVGFKLNTNRLTHEIALDLVNILGTKNILGLTYSPDPGNPNADPLREEYQLGFLPLFYYKIDF